MIQARVTPATSLVSLKISDQDFEKTPMLVRSAVKWADYMDNRHCGYCNGKSTSAISTERRGSALYSINVDNEPILLSEQLEKDSAVSAVPVGVYSEMLNRGFRRSGTTFYKIDQRNSCCPQYTMRLIVSKFKPSRDHRKALNRFNRWVLGESESNLISISSSLYQNNDIDESMINLQTDKHSKTSLKKNKKQSEYNLPYNIHRIDADFDHFQKDIGDPNLELTPNDFSFETALSKQQKLKKGQIKNTSEFKAMLHTCRPQFQISLKLSMATQEKFELYRKYQVAIHNDSFDEVTMSSFDGFLCRSPLNANSDLLDKDLSLQDVKHLGGGTFHHEYRYMGKLIAFGVLDILPGNCISSVYLVWDPAYSELELGKVSVLREIVLTQDLQLPYYCLGLYVPSCPKMHYKSSFQPTELLDPMSIPPSMLGYKNNLNKNDIHYMAAWEDVRWFPFQEFSTRWDTDGTHTDWYVSILEKKNLIPEQIKFKNPEVLGEPKRETQILGAENFPQFYVERTPIFDVFMPGIIPFESLIQALKTRFDMLSEMNICFKTDENSSKFIQLTSKQLLNYKYYDFNSQFVEIILEFIAVVGIDLGPHFAFRLN